MIWNWIEKKLAKVSRILWGDEELNHKMILKSRDLGNGRYEVSGVIISADSHPEAIRKYRRANKNAYDRTQD